MSYCTLCNRFASDAALKGGLCPGCRSEQVEASRRLEASTAPAIDRAAPDQAATNGKIILTTALDIPNRKIDSVIEVIAAEAAVGLNIFKDIANSWRDFVGGRSRTTQDALKEARYQCMRELRTEAARIGADAVIAIDLDYNEISTGNHTGGLLLVVASGTAVKLST